jgi:nucleoside-diphosphate-sugar epimerase
MRISLIGGAGFIGHNLATQLVTNGHEVQIVDNLMWNNVVTNLMQPNDFITRLNWRFFNERFVTLDKAGVKMENVDARDMNGLRNCLTRFVPEHIVHLSAISSALDAKAVPGLAFDLQLNTLKNTLEDARYFGTGVTFMSSSTVYGDFETDEVDESSPVNPKGIYATGKVMGENLCRTYNDQYDIDINIIRPSALYGERCVSRRVSQAFIENALSSKPLLLEGGGSGKLDFTYIPDLVSGIVLAIEATAGTSTYNITFGNARTIFDLAKIVQSVVPRAILEERPKADLKPVRGTLSTKRAEERLGFKAQWELERGYHKYCTWYQEQWLAQEAADRSSNL